MSFVPLQSWLCNCTSSWICKRKCKRCDVMGGWGWWLVIDYLVAKLSFLPHRAHWGDIGDPLLETTYPHFLTLMYPHFLKLMYPHFQRTKIYVYSFSKGALVF
jgi:hypothetical protein